MFDSNVHSEEDMPRRDSQNRRPVAQPRSAERPARSSEEALAWKELYASIRRPSAAVEVVKHLNADPASKQQHLALFVQASITLQERKLVTARNERIGAFVRMIVVSLLIKPFSFLKRAGETSRDIAVEAMPSVPREPAAPRTRALKNDPAFAQAKQTFVPKDSASDGNEPDAIQSRDVKAA